MCGDSVRANFCGQRKGKKPQWSMIPTLTRNTSDVLASNPPPCPPRSANHKSAAPPPAELSCSCVRQHDKEQQQRAPRETLASKSMSGTKLLSYRIPTAATTANVEPWPRQLDRKLDRNLTGYSTATRQDSSTATRQTSTATR